MGTCSVGEVLAELSAPGEGVRWIGKVPSHGQCLCFPEQTITPLREFHSVEFVLDAPE